MFIKGYVFAGCAVKIISDTPVYDSALFAGFSVGGAPDAELEITVVHAPLPEKRGETVFRDETSWFTVDGTTSYYYTSYPSANGMKQLACRVMTDNVITLFVIPGQRLWDSLLAFAVNYTQLLFYRGTVTLHASCVRTNGGAVLFTGKKGAGKSTQAALWEKYAGAEIINGDRIALKLTQNGVLACGIPFCGSSGIARNETLEVRAIVLPEKSPQNTVARLEQKQAFVRVLGNLTYNAQETAQLTAALDFTQAAVGRVPVFNLMCRPDEGAVRILEEELCRM